MHKNNIVARIANEGTISGVLHFVAPAPVTASTTRRCSDGSLVFDAVPLIADQELVYYGYELPLEELFGDDYDENWDRVYTGFLTEAAAQSTLDQFEGLPITDGHVFVETGKREEVAVGTFLQNAMLEDKRVRSRALIYKAAAVVKTETENNELSIGGDAFMRANPKRGSSGEPDFFIERLDLNHVALVESGRAGAEARLLNHKASLKPNPETVMKKITVNGVEHEVPEAVADEFP